MKTNWLMAIIIPVVLALVIAASAGLVPGPLSPARVQAEGLVFTDNFNDNIINPFTWIIRNGGGPTVAETNGRLEVLLPKTSTGEIFGGSIYSRCTLRGDVDIQVDYSLLDWPFNNGVRVGLLLSDRDPALATGITLPGATERVSEEEYGYEVYLTNFADGVRGVVATTDSSGKLRLVRVGETITGYYFSSGAWVPIHTGPSSPNDVLFILQAWSHEAIFPDQDVRIAFDNLVVTEGQLVCPSPQARLTQSVSFIQGLTQLNQGEQNSPIVKLNAALTSIDGGNQAAACGQLGAFINEVEALVRSKRLDQATGDILIGEARGITTALGCS